MSEIVNADMAAAWDGDEGDDWTVHEQHHNDAVRAHSGRLMSAAAVGASEQVLDLGCGTGETTREAARAAVDGDALGIDLGGRMLARARERAVEQGLTNVAFVQGDAQVYPFVPASFDVAVSLMGAMFFIDPVAAFTNLAGATRPEGRMVLLTWQALERNEWISAVRDAFALGRTLPTPSPGMPGPFGLTDPERVRPMLESAGWRDVAFDDVQVPFRAGADADDAFAFVSGTGIVRGLVQDLDADQRRTGFDALRATIEAHDTGTDAGVAFGSAAWIIHAVRTP